MRGAAQRVLRVSALVPWGASPWRGGRAVECGGLENRCAPDWRTESSNLSPSVLAWFATFPLGCWESNRCELESAMGARPQEAARSRLSSGWTGARLARKRRSWLRVCGVVNLPKRCFGRERLGTAKWSVCLQPLRVLMPVRIGAWVRPREIALCERKKLLRSTDAPPSREIVTRDSRRDRLAETRRTLGIAAGDNAIRKAPNAAGRLERPNGGFSLRPDRNRETHSRCLTSPMTWRSVLVAPNQRQAARSAGSPVLGRIVSVTWTREGGN